MITTPDILIAPALIETQLWGQKLDDNFCLGIIKECIICFYKFFTKKWSKFIFQNFWSVFFQLFILVWRSYVLLYLWIHFHESAIIKFFAPQTLCLSSCVARIADFGPSEPGTKPRERSKSSRYAKTTYTLWIICFKPGSLRGSISRPFDLKSNALPLRHGGKKIFGKKIWVFTPHTFLRGWLS